MKVMTSVGTDPGIDPGISRTGRKEVREGTLKASELDCFGNMV
jgi:hypothetical protein